MSQVTPIWAQYLRNGTTMLMTLVTEQLCTCRLHTLLWNYQTLRKKLVVGKNEQLRKQVARCITLFTCRWTFWHKSQLPKDKGHFYWSGLKQDTETFVAQCSFCQRYKHEQCLSTGLLKPPHVPDTVWAHVSMDFIEGSPKSHGMDVILVVVDKSRKYAHYTPLLHPYSVRLAYQAFTDNIIKLHGSPRQIMSDRDKISTTSYGKWNRGITLLTIHKQSGRQKRLNQCLETYLKCTTTEEPKKWVSWLSPAEYWYDTTYHTTHKMSPIQAMYGLPPPLISDVNSWSR